MAALLLTICVFGLIQFVWSTRYAYRLRRHELAAGYPIFGHTLHTFIVLLMIAALMPKTLAGSWIARAIGVATLVLPVLHGWLLYKLGRLGETHRLAASSEGSSAAAAD